MWHMFDSHRQKGHGPFDTILYKQLVSPWFSTCIGVHVVSPTFMARSESFLSSRCGTRSSTGSLRLVELQLASD